MLLAYRFGPVAASDLPAGVIPPSLRGVGALSGGLQGGPSPRAKATLRLDDVQAFGLGPVSAYVELDAADVAHLEADVDWGETKLASVRAHLGAALGDLVASGLAADAEVDAAATITALPLAWFAPVAPPLEGDTSLLSANVRVSGLAAAPTGDATLRLSGVPFVDGALGDVELSGALASGLATLAGAVRRGEAVHARLEAEARVYLSAEGGGPQSWPLDASLQAEDAPVSMLLPALVFGALLEDVSGVVTTSLEVGGVVAAPTVEGRVRLERVAAGVIPLRRNVEDARLVFDVEHDRLTIEELVVGDEAGSLTGEGSVELAGLTPGSYAPSLSSYALSLRLRDVVAPLDATQSASVRGRAVIEGDLNEERHQTSVMLRNLRVEIVDEGAAGVGATALPETVFFVGEDVDISQVGVRDPVRLGEEAARGELTSRLPWEISLRTEGTNTLKQSLIDVAFAVAVDAQVRGSEITLGGAVELPSGAINVAGNRFELRRGAVRFSESGDAFDPTVDIEAVHELSSQVTEHLTEVVGPPTGERASINVNVNGRVSELAEDPDEAIRLSSNPALEEQQIFSVLATGRLSGEGGSSEAQEGVAALTSLLLGVLGDRLSRGLFVDTLRIEGNAGTQRIEGGKYISDDLYVSGTFIRSPEDEDDNNFEVALEWILRRIGPGSLRMELRGGDRAKGGLELLYSVSRQARRSLGLP